MSLEKQICENCGKECIKHSRGMCTTCYKKLVWKPKLVKCSRCGRLLPHHAKGLCSGCYQTTFQLQNNKNHNYKKWYNLSPEAYKKITEKCLICGFDEVVDLHHLDKNKANNSEINLVGLCPNHHRMIHLQETRDKTIDKINEVLIKKGLKPVEKNNLFYKNNPRK